jgi:hypothetical protein
MHMGPRSRTTRRLHGVTLYREADRAFAVGDRIQLTAPNREHHLANRELGTIERLEPKDRLRLHLDSGRTVDLNVRAHAHVDYSYAVTSHSSQGQRPACSCTSTWIAPAKRSSINAWPTSLCLAAATTRRFSRMTRADWLTP